MTSSNIDVKPGQLVEKLGIDLSQYGSLHDIEDFLYHPSNFLGPESTLTYKFEKDDFEKLERVVDSHHNTGEIWEDVEHNIYYLILGKTPTADFIMTLGGPTPHPGDIEKGIITTLGKNGNFNCNHFICGGPVTPPKV